MSTKDRILKTSLQLFNQSGVSPVTTNHIAEALGMSPGNLYYHYPNKEEIIRKLLKEMSDAVDDRWTDPESTSDIHRFLEESFALTWDYRFFFREMYALRRKDKVLSRMWKQHLDRAVKRLGRLFKKWTNEGIFKELEREHLDVLITALMVTSNSYLQFYESRERSASKIAKQKAVEFCLKLLSPYFSKRYSQDLIQALG